LKYPAQKVPPELSGARDNHDSITVAELRFLPSDTKLGEGSGYKYFAVYEFKTHRDFSLVMYYRKSDEEQQHKEELSEYLVLITHGKGGDIIDSMPLSAIVYNTLDQTGSISEDLKIRIKRRDYLFKEELMAQTITQDFETTALGKFKLMKSDTSLAKVE
jgi:hypothetical protein